MPVLEKKNFLERKRDGLQNMQSNTWHTGSERMPQLPRSNACGVL